MNFKEFIQMRVCDEMLFFSFLMCVGVKFQAQVETHTHRVFCHADGSAGGGGGEASGTEDNVWL